MADKIDLWPNTLDFSTLSNNALEILVGQADLLKEKTKGKVSAALVKIEYKTIENIAYGLGGLVSPLTYGLQNQKAITNTDLSSNQWRSILNAQNYEGVRLSTQVTPIKEQAQQVDVVQNDKIDASELLKPVVYAFEIYAKNYKFRLFTLKYHPMYPISLYPETGVLDDNNNTNIVIQNDTQLIDNLKQIFSSTKLINILSRMILL